MPLSSDGERRSVRRAYVLSRFTGWNDDANNAALLDTDLRTAENVVLENANLLRSRYGYVLENTAGGAGQLNSGAAVNGVFDMIVERGTHQRVIVCCGNKILELNVSGADDVTDRTGGLTIGATSPATAASFKDALYIAQGGGVPAKVSRGTGNAAAVSNWFSDSRTPRYVHTQFNHLFFAGYATGSSPTDTLNPMTVNYGEHMGDDLWTETNVVDKVGGMGAYGDEYVTALFRHRDFLMIGTNRRIYPCSFTGSQFGRFAVHRPLEVGVADQRAVVSINGEYTFFMDSEGDIHSIRDVAEGFGDVGSVSLTKKISNYVKQLNPAKIPNTCSCYWKEQGLIMWGVFYGLTQSTPNEILVLDINQFPLNEPDYRAAVWFRWKTINANSLAILRRSSATLTTPSDSSTTGYDVPVFGTEDGWIKRFNTAVSYDEGDDGTDNSFETKVYTKYFDFGDPDHQKAIVEAHWTMQPASLNPGPLARVSYDFGRSYSNTVTIDMDTNVGESWTLGTGSTNPFILGVSKLGSSENTARSKDMFLNGGVFGSLELWQTISSTTKWKLQFVTLLVEQRGEVPETG